jgi:hypothetical protein
MIAMVVARNSGRLRWARRIRDAEGAIQKKFT